MGWCLKNSTMFKGLKANGFPKGMVSPWVHRWLMFRGGGLCGSTPATVTKYYELLRVATSL